MFVTSNVQWQCCNEIVNRQMKTVDKTEITLFVISPMLRLLWESLETVIAYTYLVFGKPGNFHAKMYLCKILILFSSVVVKGPTQQEECNK